MTGQRLLQYLTNKYPLGNDFRSALLKCATQLTLPKNHYLLEAPRVADHMFFLEKGFALSYTYFDGTKQVDKFWTTGDLIISVKSFFQQQPSLEYIRLMTESDVVFISHTDAQRLFDEFREGRYLYSAIMNRYYESEYQRVSSFRHHTAWERYHALKAAFPGIEQLVSQEHIASYIGVTPQSLSRMKSSRNDLSNDK